MWDPGEQPQKARASPARYSNACQPVRGPCSLFSLDSFLGLVPFSRKSAALPALELALREREESEQQRGKQVRMQGGQGEPPAPGTAPFWRREAGGKRGAAPRWAPHVPPAAHPHPCWCHPTPTSPGARRGRDAGALRHPGLPRHLGQASPARATANTAPGERGLGGSPWQPQSRGGAAASEVQEPTLPRHQPRLDRSSGQRCFLSLQLLRDGEGRAGGSSPQR